MSSEKRSTMATTDAHGTEANRAYQLECFQKGTNHVKLLRPATVGGGIIRLDDSNLKNAVKRFESATTDAIKFVPASGAATRMFKKVIGWIEDPKGSEKAINAFFERAEEYPFFEAWMEKADEADVETFQSGLNSKVKWLELLIGDHGLRFAQLPKGLIPFHTYDEVVTPVVEHLKEATRYSNHSGVCKLHFTVSPEHRSSFESEIKRWIKQPPFDEYQWDVSYSHQDPNTDTVAVDMENNPIEENGVEVTRPGGHGSLIHNLNALDAEIVFIKNIDNVAHDRHLDVTVKYKKALAGVLMELRADLQDLKASLSKGLLDEVHIGELRDKWKIRIPRDYRKLKDYLGRPIRVCGMVKNEGEPGGGPFYTLDRFTGESLQIVEQAQIDTNYSRQAGILQSSTHFNPVDLVCCLKDLDGNKIDLKEYVDKDLYFVAKKSYKGKEIKALEWPGLWNGAMANWITLFVEVPIETFNPVKEISDLLRPTHLPG